MNELAIFYNDVFKRRDLKHWENFFTEVRLSKYKELPDEICSFFNENCDIPHDIWMFLDKKFSLSKDSRFRWKALIKHDFGLSLDYLDENIDCDYALYSRLRFKAFEEFLDGNYESSLVKAEEAFRIYDKEPVLHRITGISNYMMGEFEKAVEAFSKALVIDPLNVDSLSYRGNIYFKIRDFKNAQKDYEAALELMPYSFYFKKKVLNCIYGEKEYKKAEDFLKNMPLRNSQDFEVDMTAYGIEKSRKPDKADKVKKLKDFSGEIKRIISSNGILLLLLLSLAPPVGVIILTFLLYFTLAFFPYIVPIAAVAAVVATIKKIYKDSFGR